MLGAIAGDIIGSVYERQNVKTTDFELFAPGSTFTDDTVLTVAVAECILKSKNFATTIKTYGRRYPHAGYGLAFREWLASDSLLPYNSFGNGAAMRVSPVGFAYNTLEKVLAEAKNSAKVTHNHPEGIKGAQVTAAAVFLARKGTGKEEIKQYLTQQFGYNLEQTLDEIRPQYSFDASCQGSVPQAVRAFLESTDYEDAVRKAISLGGDSDTIACITGGIAQAYYRKIPPFIIKKAKKLLAPELWEIVEQFNRTVGIAL
ncbi:MAG: ADP-ribosylglycohydrolase family protein [Firmicutes bacterium]|nr:ADP-ribosylglycohydrolase family protein [Bacillota bacterium]